MAEDKPVIPTPTELSTEQAQAVGGGDCSLNDYMSALENLKQAYERVIDFTSYVIERVGGP
jgi:hypothetical protein